MNDLLSPDESVRFLQPRLCHQLRRIVPVLGIGADGRVTAKGTAALVRFHGYHLVVTARHVIQHLRDAGSPPMTAILPFEPDETPVRVPSAVAAQPITLEPALVDVPELDVCVFRAPATITSEDGLDWYNGDEGAYVAGRESRTDWIAIRDDPAAIPFVIAGFGNLAHFTLEAERLELLGATPLLCQAVSWDPPSHSRPQITLVPDVNGPTIEGLTPLERAIAANLDTRTARGGEVVGGYSGGPAAIVGRDGEFLVGIVYEGGLLGDRIVVYARPWDRIAQAVARVLP